MDSEAQDHVERIVAFLTAIGVPVVAETLTDKSFLPGLEVRNGGLVYDPKRLAWPGDLLHEAGHIAVTDPALRPSFFAPSDDPAEEMAAIAWSWSAAMAFGLAPEILFHEGGYRGASSAFIESFSNGRDVGVP